MFNHQASRSADFARSLILCNDGDIIELEAVNTPGATDAAAIRALMPHCIPDGYDAGEIEKVAEKIIRGDPGEQFKEREQFITEAIIIPDKRPAIDITNDDFWTDHPLWLDYNSGDTHANLVAGLASIGRLELPGHPSLPYGGTGFVVAPELLMTNRHVAALFATGSGLRSIDFIPGIGAAIDFKRERDPAPPGIATVPVTIEVKGVVMIHPYWDMALIAVEGLEGHPPLKLAHSAPANPGKTRIAVVGYPAFDPRNPTNVQNRVFRGLYGIKRLQPGLLTGTRMTASFAKQVEAMTHDSSTLGGNSGSAVIEAATGHVVALHFGGLYQQMNFGVPAAALAKDGRVIDAGVCFDVETPHREPGPWDAFWAEAHPERTTVHVTAVGLPNASASNPLPPPPAGTGSNRISVTVPVTITVEVGRPQSAIVPTPAVPPTSGEVMGIEAPLESYADRVGYVAGFLGPHVPLPNVAALAEDVLAILPSGNQETVLRYEHFSVVMSRSRRMCFFSAVNIDGARSRKAGRGGWRIDPRIPAEQQILHECYGNPPKFSRGHMTRREDPVWGDEAAAARGNDDSMHVTNTVPQMQAFNAPIWLGLEDYALQHARSDSMRISVFTGPYFDPLNDPIIWGVRIPIRFWKVIAFIHDETGRLSATGYEMSQDKLLPTAGHEFVFGGFTSPQVGIATQTALGAIEHRSGISFNGLADHDPLTNGAESTIAADDFLLQQFEQIRFV